MHIYIELECPSLEGRQATQAIQSLLCCAYITALTVIFITIDLSVFAESQKNIPYLNFYNIVYYILTDHPLARLFSAEIVVERPENSS
jgi:hypothetical protein